MRGEEQAYKIAIGVFVVPTYLLTWNPNNWDGEITSPMNWSCGHTKRIRVGDRLFIMRQGREPRGVCVSGWAVSDAFEDEDGRFVGMSVEISLNSEAEPILSRLMLDELNRGVDRPMKWGIQSSGTQIPDDVAQRLERAWKELCQSQSIRPSPTLAGEALDISTSPSAVVAGKHFLSYHNAERMGHAFEEATPFSVAASKSVKGLVGERVWSVSGEGRPRRYILRDTWVVKGVGGSEQDEFSNSAYGDGVIFDPPIALSGRSWFPAFLKSQSNFSLGLLPIKSEYVPHFELLLSAQSPPIAPPTDHVAEPAERRETSGLRIIRDTQLTKWVKALYNYECQLCGHTIVLPDESRYAEGHHVQPLGAPHNGPDISDNILCLCPNHHAACDYGAMSLVAAELRRASGHVVGQHFLDYHNRVVYRGTRPQSIAKEPL